MKHIVHCNFINIGKADLKPAESQPLWDDWFYGNWEAVWQV